jgi:predicted nucleic acid-binding protein
MEIMGKYQLSEAERALIGRVISKCHIIDINSGIKQLSIKIKQTTKIKIPDAIIAATSMLYGLPLVSADKELSKIDDLDLLLINPCPV